MSVALVTRGMIAAGASSEVVYIPQGGGSFRCRMGGRASMKARMDTP